MGLFSIFKKKKKVQEEDLNKKYLSIGNVRYDEEDLLTNNDLFEFTKKYYGYEKKVDLSNADAVHSKVQEFMSELNELKFFCLNYEEFGELYNNYKEIPLTRVAELGMMECLVLLTSIQRRDYWNGVSYDVFYGYTKTGLIPKIIERMYNLYQSRMSVHE